jgi:malonyl-CoA/methylmalonyl-CoA synthetase
VRLHAEEGLTAVSGVPGELQVKGPTVFRQYWKRPEVTADSFTDDGWFKTGDIAMMDEEGDYRIMGRASQDIIKTGGYKVSALEIEAALLELEFIAECAVIGLPDEEWGERVAAVIVLRTECTEQELKATLKDKLAPYKIPSCWKFCTELPRNAMGKVIKPELKKQFV